MFDYTRAAFRKIAKDFKTLGMIFHFAMQGIYLIYLIYALITQPDSLIINIVLTVLATAYLIFNIVIAIKENSEPNAKQTKKEKKEKKKKTKQAKKKARKIYKWCKHIVNLFPLVLLIYNIWRTSSAITSFAVILVALQLAGWVLSTLFKLTGVLLERTVGLVIEGLKTDVEPLTKPVTATSNFFKRITGQEVDEPTPPSPAREQLEELVEQEREEKKEEKKQQKERATAFWKGLFRRNNKALPASEEVEEAPETEEIPIPTPLPEAEDALAPLEEIAVTEKPKFWQWKK